MMALFREFNQSKNTVTILYKGEPLTPEMSVESPTELLDGLTNALEIAYQKIRDAGLE
jgi:hypothetical protein